MKYEEVYFDGEKRSLKVAEVLEVYFRQKELFETSYRDHLWCPDCKQVQIGVVVSGGVHLRGYRTQEHLEGCEHQQPVYVPVSLDEIKESPEDIGKIQHQIDTLIRRTYIQQIGHIHRNKSGTSVPPIGSKALLFHGKIRPDYRLPQKRIDSTLEPEDFEFAKVFYGLVKTHWNPVKHFLWLYVPDTKKRLCGLYITDLVESYLRKANIPFHDCPYAHIAFLGKLFTFPDGTPKCTLEDSRFLKLEESPLE